MKFKVTKELATAIRMIRMQSGISSKDLAAAVGRSPSYITKLEKGDVKNIRKDELTEIFSYLIEGEDFFRDKFPVVIRAISTFGSPEDLFRQSWLMQYDIYERPILVPEALCREISDRMHALGIDAEELAAIINANEDVRDRESLPANEIVMLDYPKGQIFRLKAEIRPDQIRSIAGESDRTTCYGNLYSILFILVKLRKFGRIGFMNPPEAKEVLLEAGRILALHEVYSMTKYGQVLASGEFQSHQLLVLNTFDTVNSNTLNEIIEVFRRYGEMDKRSAMETADTFLLNLEWDPAFMMKVVSQDFHRIGTLSFSNKKKLLEEISELVSRYEDMPDLKKKLEHY